jgi:hypothetical protein
MLPSSQLQFPLPTSLYLDLAVAAAARVNHLLFRSTSVKRKSSLAAAAVII